MAYTVPANNAADFDFSATAGYVAPGASVADMDFTPPDGGNKVVSIDGQLPGLSGPAQVVQGQFTSISGQLPGIGGAANVIYFTNTERPTVGRFGVVDQKAKPRPAGADLRWVDANPLPKAYVPRYQDAAPRPRAWSLSWVEATPVPVRRDGRYQQGKPLGTRGTVGYQDSTPVHRWRDGRYQEATRVPAVGPRVRYQQSIAMRNDAAARFQDAVGHSSGAFVAFQNGVALHIIERSRYQNAARVLAGASEHPIHPPGGGGDPGTGETVVVPVKRVYVVLNEVSLRRVDGDIPLPTISMSMSLDVDSWTWSFSASLPTFAKTYVEPNTAGDPVEVEANINGVPYRLLVESMSRDRSFGQDRLNIGGRGLSATLDAPYSPILNFGNTGDRTAQQLMSDVLTMNGVSLGWDVDWQIEDWTVPGAIWTQQGSYIDGLKSIVQAAGGYLQPVPSGKSLRALLRYPTAPWAWGDVTPDYELPAALAVREGIEWTEKARYNRVFVSGVGAGVNGQVTRAGTDGGLVAPQVTDSLILSATPARQRGISVLADTGRIANVSLRLPVLAETGVIPPGKFIRYVDNGVPRIGITRSVSLDVGLPEVFQTISLECHES